jgi:hypothetical protein
VLLECGDGRPWALALMLGGGAGIGLSLHFSADGITPGLSRALTSGTLWGLWHGAMLGIGTHAFANAREEDKATVLGLGLGQLAGLGVGGALYAGLEPTAGQVSLTSSGGIWTTVATGLGMLLLDADPDGETVAVVLLVASDIGLLAGGYLASRAPMSAGRVLLLDAGGLLGTLGGAGLAVLLAGEDREPPFVGGAGLLGAASGLALAYYLTLDWDDDDSDGEQALALSLVPAPGGAIAAARVAF